MLDETTSTDASITLSKARRIVVKVGSSLVTNEGRGLHEEAIAQWCEQLAALVNDGLQRGNC
jgi:glutamate 5-kinase